MIEKYLVPGLEYIGLGLEPVLAIIILVVALLFSAKEPRLGMLVALLFYGAGLILAYSIGWNTTLFTLGVLVSFVLLTLSLVSKGVQEVY